MSMVLALLLATQAAPAGAAAPAPVAVDPARLPVATRVAGRLMPDGTYRTMMKAMTDQVIGMISGQMSDLPMRDIVRLGGLSEDEAAKLGPATINDMMEVLDPAYQRRTDITMRVIFDEMGELMTGMEPEYRAGLADALASRFTREQLGELDAFFATPTGAAYAGQSLALYTDPTLMARMQGMMPRIMSAMPGIMKKVEAATADLPKARDPETLTTEERARLEALLRLEDDK
ncbi:hypothetical protein [Sphingomonas sp.]|uniref:hypothetical protein n=1 Tax=Sphingomonas sp. TaxID=28214 RepID=UPI002DD695FD|nr:hypothetical protein [Sphingomonas sp.]